MIDKPALPASVRSPLDAITIEKAARRFDIPCGEGTMVWRCWGDGEPVVLLHGGSGSWTHWVRNIAALVTAGRQVWIPDLPGFGQSARPPVGGDADALPEPVESAMRELLGDAAVDLVGFSFGGMVASFIAAQYPARVRRLVLVGAPALGVNSGWKLVLKRWNHLEPGKERDAIHRENIGRMMLARPESIDELAIAVHSGNLPRDRMKLRRLSRTDILRRTLPKIRCQVHGIWGSEDVLYRGVQDQLAPALACAPDFRGLVQVPGSGHWVQFEDAAAFDEALAAALQCST
ncbi:MAG: alpha/beta hydrolase [Limnobacter sp.]|nr:alpha/beta hydrolase [Limnobacter sp.]